MNKKLFSKADEQSIELVERAVGDLRALGATIVDPGPEGALFQGCIARSAPRLSTRRSPPGIRRCSRSTAAVSQPPITSPLLLEMDADPSRVPEALSLRSLGGYAPRVKSIHDEPGTCASAGDANIKSNADLSEQGHVLSGTRISPIAGRRV